MEKIKYRAYIKELWKIYEVITLMTKKFEWEDFLRVFINKEAEEWEPANYRIDGIDNVLMQFTGLKDKNNLEIFAGDRLYFPLHKDAGIVEYIDSMWAFVVRWEIIYDNTIMKSENLHSELAYRWSSCEVIGNIYENLIDNL